VDAVKKQCNIILKRNGGDACVREFIEQEIATIG
jgi:3-deoxy-D-manno-octulosonate 8-phosphate phosphatase KdsC-like HAD superfamily phosphatase